MKKSIIIIGILLITIQINAQELTHNTIKSLMFESTKQSFPMRFNTSEGLKDMFYQRCNEYPKYCRKLKFVKFLGLRIDEVKSSNNEYEVIFSFEFMYSKGKNDFIGSATMVGKLTKVLDQYKVAYLKFSETSGRYFNFKHKDQEILVLLGTL